MHKKILFIVNGIAGKDSAPQSPFVLQQAISLRTIGWEVDCFFMGDNTSFSGIIYSLKQLRKKINMSTYAVIHCQYGSVVGLVSSLSKGKLPLVVSFCGDDILGTPNPGLLWRIREKLSFVFSIVAGIRSRKIIVKSRNILNALPPFLKSKAHIIPNGVNDNFFSPMDNGLVRSELKWNDKRIVLFNYSKDGNSKVKNLPLAQESVMLVKKQFPNVELIQLSDFSQDMIVKMMNAADCLLVTSLHEGSPNIVKEAMSCNLPVVSVPCGDVAERLKGVSPGAVCDYNAFDLAAYMVKVLQHPTRSNGREMLIRQGLSSSAIANKISELYNQTL